MIDNLRLIVGKDSSELECVFLNFTRARLNTFKAVDLVGSFSQSNRE